jgi:hypothetical protein
MVSTRDLPSDLLISTVRLKRNTFKSQQLQHQENINRYCMGIWDLNPVLQGCWQDFGSGVNGLAVC